MTKHVLVCCNGQQGIVPQGEDVLAVNFSCSTPHIEESVRNGDYDYVVADGIALDQLFPAIQEAHVPHALWSDILTTRVTYDHRFPSRTPWPQIEAALRFRLRDLSYLPSGVENSEIWVLDDENAVRETVSYFLAEVCQLPVRGFGSFDEVLDADGGRPGIILADGDLRQEFGDHGGYLATENFLKLLVSLYPDILVLRWSGDVQSLPSIWGGAFAKPCNMEEVAHCVSNSWRTHVWARAYR